VPEAAAQCPACRRGVRAGTQFCPGCGQTLAAPAAPARDDAAASSERFERQWGELKRVGWLFGLLLSTSFVFGIAWRAEPSPWPVVIMSAVDATIVLVAVGLSYRKLLFLFQLRAAALRDAAALVAIAVVFVGLASAYFWALERLGVPIASATATFTRAGWPLWTMFLLISVMPAVDVSTRSRHSVNWISACIRK